MSLETAMGFAFVGFGLFGIANLIRTRVVSAPVEAANVLKILAVMCFGIGAMVVVL